MKDRGKLAEQVDGRAYADSDTGVAGHTSLPPEPSAPSSPTFRNRAGVKIAATPEGGTLIFAVTVAMLLGVACGLWLSARLASSALESPALSQPTLNADRSEVVTTESAPSGREGVSTAVSEPTPPNAAGESDEGREAGSTPPRAPADDAEGGRGVNNAARAAAVEAEAPRETTGRKNATAAAAERAGGAGASGSAAPCPLYASAGALTVRNGGEVALVLASPGQQGRVSVTTPDWSDIAVFYKGQAGGNRGWIKYSVRSVSNRAGVFSVRVKGLCGSLTIPVTVVRP